MKEQNSPRRQSALEAGRIRKLARGFVANPQSGGRIAIAQEIAKLDGPIGLSIAAHALADVATRPPTSDLSHKSQAWHLNAARSYAEKAIDTYRYTPTYSSAFLKSLGLLAELPILKAMFLEHTYPDATAMQNYYTTTNQVLESGRALRRREGQAQYINSQITGYMSELCIKQLFNRFALRELGGEGYIATSAPFSGDNIACADPTAAPWDVEVFDKSLHNGSMQPAYKVQVTAGNKKEVPSVGVAQIGLHDLTNEQALCNLDILSANLLGEANWDDQQATKKLDIWTDGLLNEVDRTEEPVD